MSTDDVKRLVDEAAAKMKRDIWNEAIDAAVVEIGRHAVTLIAANGRRGLPEGIKATEVRRVAQRVERLKR